MGPIVFASLTEGNFHPDSLDGFIRCQDVKECWRMVGGKLVLLPVVYTEDWDLGERRAMAAQILKGLSNGGMAYGAFCQGRVAGFALLAGRRFGSEQQYIDLAEFYVSQPFRGRGIGKGLFRLACQGAKALGAAKLYISAHSAKETMAAYRKLGCVDAAEINRQLAEKEPCDVQLEYSL